jgi:hypothetical protein
MIRGAIDYTSSDRIGGWIYSPENQVRGKTVLAFVDNTCVGAGSIDQFREDLAKAGLGDGFIGFNFGITPAKEEDLGKLIVKIEGSDFALLQADSLVAGSGGGMGPSSAADRPIASIEWMRSQGWLDQPEYDFLKFLRQSGIYDRSLRRPRTATTLGGLDEPDVAATNLFSLMTQKPVQPITSTFSDAEDFAVRRTELLSALAEPIVAIWGASAGELLVVEGSHIESLDKTRSLTGAIAHSFGPDRLLFIDLRCDFGSSGNPGGELRVLGLPAE